MNIILKRVFDSGKKKIGLVGLTFKAGTDDLRNSASVALANTLLENGFSLKIYDRFLNLAKAQGEDIGSRLPAGMENLLENDIYDLCDESELIIIAVKNPELPKMIYENPKICFLDLVRLKDESVLSLKITKVFAGK